MSVIRKGRWYKIVKRSDAAKGFVLLPRRWGGGTNVSGTATPPNNSLNVR
jgi:hypothetical protein